MSEKLLTTSINPETLNTLLQLVSEGLSIEKSCAKTGVEKHVLWRLLSTSKEVHKRFSDERRKGLEKLADDLLDIPDDYEEIARGKLKSDNIKWLLAKRLPHEYGEKVQVDVNHNVDLSGALQEAKRRVLPKRDLEIEADAQAIETTNLISSTESSEADDTDNDAVKEDPSNTEPIEIDIFL